MSRVLLFGIGTCVSMLTMAGVFLQGYAAAERRSVVPEADRPTPPDTAGS